MRKSADTLFVALLLALLLGSLIKTVFLPKDINYLENRYAQKLPELSASDYLSGNMQDQVEVALSDQLPFSESLISNVNLVKSRVSLVLLNRAMKYDPNHYYTYSSERFFGGRICYPPKPLSSTAEAISVRTENLNSLFRENDGIIFYAYFIENDSNIDFETGENSGTCDALLSGLNLPENQKGAFRLTGFDDFARDFYMTDHHWNDQGARRAYAYLAQMLDFKPLAPFKTVVLENALSGSKAKSIGAQDFLSEEVTVSVYSLPELETSVNGKPGTYGNEAVFLAGKQKQALTYGAYYGGDEGEVIFTNHAQPQLENLLIIGDSYDNALLKLLASHYHCTYSIDLRYYTPHTGERFLFSEYIKAHEIDCVLFIGSTAFWTASDFAVEG